MAVRRDALLAIGGFDERIGPGAGGVQAGEDADVIARLLRSGRVLASGTGAPVRHADWRAPDDDAATLLAYERGAGVWIGAALRARDRVALHHLRARLRMVRPRAAHHARSGEVPAGLRLGWELTRGLASGLRLTPWAQRSSSSAP
jgi:hypothetical protein